MTILEVAAGETLVTEGEPATEFFVLLEGEAVVERGGSAVRTLGPGDFFGEVALVARTRRTATVTATEPSRVAVFDEHAFRERLAADERFSAEVWAAAAARY
jgi:CRP-like cAMP-binding protein